MALPIDRFTLGVEEENQLVDAETLALVARQDAVLHAAERALGDAVQPELQRSMIEIATPVCTTLGDVRAELGRARGDDRRGARARLRARRVGHPPVLGLARSADRRKGPVS